MPKAIELIVDVYVQYQNRRALGDLMVHRQRLAAMLYRLRARVDVRAIYLRERLAAGWGPA